MTLTQLEVLVKVVEAGSFTRAAEVLRMQRSNVSRAVSQLESELGVVLLDRNTRRQSVTEAGREVYERAAVILDAVAATRQITQRLLDAPRGCLRLTCSVEYGMVAPCSRTTWLATHRARSMWSTPAARSTSSTRALSSPFAGDRCRTRAWWPVS